MKLHDRVRFRENGKLLEGKIVDFQQLSPEAVIETGDGLTHIVRLSEIEQPSDGLLEFWREVVRLQTRFLSERLPESEFPSFKDAGIER